MRWFFPLLTIAGCGAGPSPAAEAPPAPAPAEASVAEAPAPPPIPLQADLHVDTPTQLHRRGVGLDDPALESGVPAMRAGGTNVVVMVAWPPRDADGYAHTTRLLELVRADDARLDEVALARTPAEARRIAADGKIALVLAIEGAHGLLHPGEPASVGTARLAALRDGGLSMLGLTWSMSNPYAGSSGDKGGGLTAEGRALVAEARRLGIALDVSHASRAATTDVCTGTPIPVIASHSDADVITPNARNLTDAEIRCIAATGGVIGVNFHAPFLGPGDGVTRAADHLDHLARIGGRGVVALGSDYDGMIQTPPGLPTAASLGRLWDELRRRGWSEADVAAARGENFLRAWEHIVGKAG